MNDYKQLMNVLVKSKKVKVKLEYIASEDNTLIKLLTIKVMGDEIQLMFDENGNIL